MKKLLIYDSNNIPEGISKAPDYVAPEMPYVLYINYLLYISPRATADISGASFNQDENNARKIINAINALEYEQYEEIISL